MFLDVVPIGHYSTPIDTAFVSSRAPGKVGGETDMTAIIGTIDYDHMTREQAVAICSAEAVAAADAAEADFTNRLMDDASTEVEFSASVQYEDAEWEGKCTLTAYYYQEQADVDANDLSNLDWSAHHYQRL